MRNICRDSVFNYSFTKHSLLFLARGTCFSFLVIPAMFFSCDMPSPAEVTNKETFEQHKVKSSHFNYDIETLDAFFFDIETNNRLDCYQRLDNPQEVCNLASGSGPKTLFLIANSRRERYDWTDIKNLSTIADICVNLEDERPDFPVLTSLQKTTAGEDINLNLTPLTCEITLRSIRCNFTEKPYANEKFTLKRIFLTYVNATTSIVPESNDKSTRIINAGMLDENHLESFYDKDIIVKEIEQVIGAGPSSINCSLHCYENTPKEESIGSPFTKLVIEGQIAGDTYYYPIRVNASRGGVTKGSSYIFDIVVTRTGATSPDGELNEGEVDITMEVKAWKEKDSHSVEF